MRTMQVSAYSLAERYIGTQEVPGKDSNPLVLAMLKLDDDWPTDDEVPWCSAFVNFICWSLRLPRSKSLRARSWLNVGHGIAGDTLEPGFDVVILRRGKEPQPGPEIIKAPGHVGFFGGWAEGKILLLGGNQSDGINVRAYDDKRILGLRRLR